MQVVDFFKDELNLKRLFLYYSCALLFLMPFLSFDFGITDDEPLENLHGKIVLDYFKGASHDAQNSPYDASGVKLKPGFAFENHDLLNLQGDFFDLLTNFVYDHCKIFGEYETRHFINSLFGVLAMIFTGLLAMRLAGWRVGLLALVFISLTPRFFGHSMDNPKDLPNAALYIAAIYFIVKLMDELPRFRWKTLLPLILCIAISIDIRPSGVLLIAYLLMMVGCVALFRIYENSKAANKLSIDFRSLFLTAGKVILLGALAYLGASVLWPYAHLNPFTIPIKALNAARNPETNWFDSYMLFDGTRLHNKEMPWYFIPKTFWITFPLFLNVGIFLIPLAFFKTKFDLKFLQISFVLFTSLFPVITAILTNAPSYDDARHFLFALPPLVVCCAIGWNKLVELFETRYLKYAAVLAMTGFCLQSFAWCAINHPLEVMYFSPVTGGINGAFKQYEMDYWGFSVKPAVEWIAENVKPESPGKPIRVRMWYGSQEKTRYYVAKYSQLQFVTAQENSTDWDYYIELPAESKFKPDLLANWPPAGTVYEVKASGVPLCAVVKNNLTDRQALMLKEANEHPSVNSFLQLSLNAYNTGNFNQCILYSKKALQFDTTNFLVLNNMGASYNNLEMYKDGFEACTKALKYKPDYELTKNNLKVAKLGLDKSARLKPTLKQLLAFSYNYFMQEEYVKCIEASRKVIAMDPKNGVAYNNMCASFNNLGAWEEAKSAGEKAVEFSPGSELAKNNLKLAVTRLNELRASTRR